MHIAEKELLIDISASKTATQVRRNEFNRVLDYDREEIGLVSTCIWCNDVIKTTSESVLRIIISRISNQISGTNLLLTRILNKSWLMGQFSLPSTWNCVNLWNLKVQRGYLPVFIYPETKILRSTKLTPTARDLPGKNAFHTTEANYCSYYYILRFGFQRSGNQSHLSLNFQLFP